MMRTSNPALNDAVFRIEDTGAARMTLEGTVMKTAILLALLLVGAGFTWSQTMASIDAAQAMNAEAAEGVALPPAATGVYGYILGGAIVGLILAMITIFKPSVSPYTTPIYALAQGVFLGAFSAMMEYVYPGLILQAVALTFGTLAALLTAYTTRIIRATENFKLGVFAATGGIALFYVATMVLGFFGVRVPYVFEAGPIGIAFSLFVVVIAALNLVLDFDFIEQGAAQGAPKYMEWYGGFGLLVTLIWLYLEIVRLLAKLRSND